MADQTLPESSSSQAKILSQSKRHGRPTPLSLDARSVEPGPNTAKDPSLKGLFSSYAPYLAFFLSGASSLIFQTIWTRSLHHVFGATSLAISTVLTCFMAGLGLGTYITGKYASRIKHPIFTYAFAELGVALWGLLIPFLVASDGWLAWVNASLRQSLGAESTTFMLARFLCVFPILLIPTTLMGSTLPLLTRHFVSTNQDAEGASVKVGTLYAINTAGAALGPLLSAFVLLPTVGLWTTNIIACSMNFCLAVAICLLRKRLIGSSWSSKEKLSIFPRKKNDEDRADEAEEQKAEKRPFSVRAARTMAWLSFSVGGAASMCYEVVWSRALAMVIGSSIYSFAIILDTFLVGIASGSALMSAFLGRGKILRTVAVASSALVLLANTPWAVDMRVTNSAGNMSTQQGSIMSWLLISALPLFVIVATAMLGERQAKLAEISGGDSDRALTSPMLFSAAVPVCVAVINLWLYSVGYLPKILATVVCLLALFFMILALFRRHPMMLLALVQIFIGLSTLASYIWQDEIPYAFAQLVAGIPTEDLANHIGTVKFFTFLTSSLCMLPSTLAMGAMFPLAIRIWTSGGKAITSDVAKIYTGNTLGSIVGSWLPGFLLFPLLGMERTLHLGIVLNLLLALASLIVGSLEDEKPTPEPEGYREGLSPAQKPHTPRWHAALVYVLSPAIPAVLALLYVGTQHEHSPLRWNLAQMTLGVFRVSLAQSMLDEESWGQPNLVYYHDGLSTTVSVERWGQHYALKNNGKVDASNGDDMPTQVTVAAYPLLLHPNGPKDLDVAIVGFGSGVTVGTALSFPVKRVDVMELERSVPDAARFFQDVNHLDYTSAEYPYVHMDRLSVINDDGRNYLASSGRKYDVIISEPSNPWITGVSDLFTVDHFRITKRSLRSGGIYCQWVQLYELSPENIKSIYRTFATAYPYVTVLAADDGSSDTVMLGSDEPIRFDLERLETLFETERVTGRPSVREELDRARIRSPHELISRVLFSSRDEVLAFTQIEERLEGGRWDRNVGSVNTGLCEMPNCRRVPAALNTDDNARIEFSAPNDLIGFARFERYVNNTFYASDWPYADLRSIVGSNLPSASRSAHFAELGMALTGSGRFEQAAHFIQRSNDVGPTRETTVAAETLSLLISDAHAPPITVEPIVPADSLDRQAAERVIQTFDRVKRFVDQNDFAAALSALEALDSPYRRAGGPSVSMLYAYLLLKAPHLTLGRSRTAAEELSELVQTYPEYAMQHPAVFYYLSKALDGEQERRDALRYMRQYVEIRFVEAERARVAPTLEENEDTESPANPASTDASRSDSAASAPVP